MVTGSNSHVNVNINSAASRIKLEDVASAGNNPPSGPGGTSSPNILKAMESPEMAIIKPEKQKVKYYHLNSISPEKSEKIRAKMTQVATEQTRNPNSRFISLKELTNSPRFIAFDWNSIPRVDYTPPAQDQRSVIMAHKPDVVLEMEMPDKAFIEYLARVNVGPKAIIATGGPSLLDGINASKDSLKKVLSHNSTWVPFYTGKKDVETGKIFSSHLFGNPDEKITLKYYEKDRFKDICENAGIKTAPGEVFSKQGKGDAEHLKKLIDKYGQETGTVIIRPVAEASGTGIMFIDRTAPDLDEQIKNVLNLESPRCLVETAYDLKDTNAIYGAIIDNKSVLTCTNSQLLRDRISHHGNIFDFSKDIDSEMKKQTLKIAEEMIKDEYKGPFGVDFIKTTDDRLFPVECNARMNGGMPVFELVNHLRDSGREFNHVVSSKIPIPPGMNFAEIINKPGIKEAIYEGTNKPGIFPFNTVIIPHGNFSAIALANSRDEAIGLMESFRNTLGGAVANSEDGSVKNDRLSSDSH